MISDERRTGQALQAEQGNRPRERLYPMLIDVVILQNNHDRRTLYTFLKERYDPVTLELLSLLCTFEDWIKCIKISFDDSNSP